MIGNNVKYSNPDMPKLNGHYGKIIKIEKEYTIIKFLTGALRGIEYTVQKGEIKEIK